MRNHCSPLVHPRRSSRNGLLLLSTILSSIVLAEEWPQLRGPRGDGASTESIAASWVSGSPQPLWKAATSRGFGSMSVAGGRVFTLVTRDLDGAPREVCLALDSGSGRELWATPVGIAKYDGGGDSGTSDNQGGDGPRSTPAVADGKVFVFNAQLGLHCLDAASGKEIWRRDLLKEHGGRNIQWQNAASPVLEGNLVLVAGGGPGQSFLGVHQQGGRVVWKSGDEKITHATPVVATLSGVRQVIFFTQSGLVSVATQDGRELWRHRFKFNVSTAASPVVADPVVYCSAGYGVGGTAVRITRQGDEFSATELWRTPGDKDVANHWSTPVHYRGHLYGMFSFKKFGDGPLKCVEIATGRVRWEKAGFGAGNVILAGDRLLALTDFGELVMVAARPDAYQEVGRTRAVGGKCWSTPALAASRLYVRSTTEGACLDLSTQTPSSGQ